MLNQAQESIRLDAWRSVFQKTNRILSEQRVNVSIVPEPQNVGMAEVPAWSDGLNIYLSGPKIEAMLASNDKIGAVLRLKGLNYHELCHVLYTPRMSDELCRRLVQKTTGTRDKTWWYAFNALEDQRIETWFASTYGASRRYFEATILEWIIKNGTAESAVLIYGRKYLTPRIRVQAGRVFRKRYDKALYDEFQTVIDEYLTLVLPQDGIKAWQLITTYVELLKKMQAQHGAPLPMLVIDDNGGDTCPEGGEQGIARHGRVYVKPARDAAKRAAEAIEDAIDADLEEEAARAAESGATEPAEAEPGDSGGEGSQPGPEQDGGKPNPDGSNTAGDGTSDDHVAGPGETSFKEEMDALQDAAHNGMDEVREDEAVQGDIDRVLDAVKAAEHNGKMNAQGKAAGGGVVMPNDRANMAVRRVHDILSRIRQDAEPETLWRQNHGRVDARRIIQRKPHETDIFKMWAPGNEEETVVESVVLVDVSGSMSSVQLVNASAAMWALKRAFDKLDIRTTVLIFDTDHTVMYQPSEKANGGGIPILKSGGGTNPMSALKQAEYIFSKSQAPNKVLIAVTDGGWQGNEDDYKRHMKSLHAVGVTSMILGIANAVTHNGKHGFMEGHDIHDVSQLPKAALKLVASIMRNAIY